MVHRVGRRLVKRRRTLFERCEGDLHGLLQLRVSTFAPGLGVELHFDVRVSAVILHIPLTVGTPEGEVRSGYRAAVDQPGIFADADQATPGALADQLSDGGAAKVPG